MTNSKRDVQQKEEETKRCPGCNAGAIPFVSEYGFYHKCPKCGKVF